MLRLCSVRCPHMNQITLEDTLEALKQNRYVIDVPENIRVRGLSGSAANDRHWLITAQIISPSRSHCSSSLTIYEMIQTDVLIIGTGIAGNGRVATSTKSQSPHHTHHTRSRPARIQHILGAGWDYPSRSWMTTRICWSRIFLAAGAGASLPSAGAYPRRGRSATVAGDLSRNRRVFISIRTDPANWRMDRRPRIPCRRIMHVADGTWCGHQQRIDRRAQGRSKNQMVYKCHCGGPDHISASRAGSVDCLPAN